MKGKMQVTTNKKEQWAVWSTVLIYVGLILTAILLRIYG